MRVFSSCENPRQHSGAQSHLVGPCGRLRVSNERMFTLSSTLSGNALVPAAAYAPRRCRRASAAGAGARKSVTMAEGSLFEKLKSIVPSVRPDTRERQPAQH